jgi:hypothetical protein
LSDDRSTIGDALRSDWAYSTPLMALTMLMPILGIFSRAQDLMPSSSVWIWLVASIVPGFVGLAFFSLLSKLILRYVPTHPAFVAIAAWCAAGLVVALVAIAIRLQIPGSTPAVPYNSFLLLAVTVATMALLTVGRFRLAHHEGQLQQALRQEQRLERAQREEIQSGLEKLEDLAREVDTLFTPEITRLEAAVASLGESSSSVQLRALHDDIRTYASTMVRETSHSLATDTFRETTRSNLGVSGGKLRWRGTGGIWDMVLSAHLTVGLVVIGGAYLFTRYARAGCIDAVALATASYMIVGLGAYWISTSPLLRQRPWALIALVSGTTGGFITLHYVLSLEPGCVPEYPTASLAIDFVVSLTVLIALVVLFEAGRTAQVNADSIARTNEELAASTVRIQRTNAVTRSSMAQILHGGVQGRLSSMSLAIRRYVDSETSGQQMSLMDLKQRLDFQLMEVRDELAHLTSTTRNTQVNVEDGLRKAIMQWRGLLAISYEITPQASSELVTRNYLSWAASEIIDAAITNSNLHGHATQVWITIAVDSLDGGSCLEVTIEDDGIGPPSDVHPGMGLESVSAFGGTWQFTSGFQGGCQLKTRLPIN